MLVLSRKNHESVIVGGSAGFERMLKVTVLEIDSGKVKLGFEVDKEVPVHRWEVWERIQAGTPKPIRPEGRGPPGAEWNHHNPLLQGIGHSRPMELPNAALAVARKHGILVADDEPSIRGMLSVSLREQGFNVWLAADGQQALDLYERHSETIDVVLLDVRMPGRDGPRTLVALQEMNPEIRCCFMSGDLGSKAATVLQSLGAATVIRKPFHPGEVAQMLWELATRAERRPASV
jgi:carbon storage regulator CsrA